MSQTDSFIDEVTEELRRDRIFSLLKKYGWIAILIVLLIVGGTAFREWQKATQQTAAEAFGDRLLNVLEEEEASTRALGLREITPETPAQKQVLSFLEAGQLATAAQLEDADGLLSTLATDTTNAPIYRQLAAFQAILLQMERETISAQDAILQLQALSSADSALRILAEEQLVLIEFQSGQEQAARTRLAALLADAQTAPATLQRLLQLQVILGESE